MTRDGRATERLIPAATESRVEPRERLGPADCRLDGTCGCSTCVAKQSGPQPTPAVLALREYAVTSQEVWREAGSAERLKLDWNEATVSHDVVRLRLVEFLSQHGAINWYPDVAALDLSKALAAAMGVSPLQVLAFGGSDVALETIARTYLSPGDSVAIVQPGYDNFRVYAESCGARTVPVAPGDSLLECDVKQFISRVYASGPVKLVYVVNPNNPVGYLIPRDGIRRILEAFPAAGVIIDEAYVEFAAGEDASSVQLVGEYPNLFVTRSFSKAFGLAGLRLGYVASHQQNLRHIRKLRNGKNLSMFAQVAALALLEQPQIIHHHIAQVLEGRALFLKRYREMGGCAFDSHANFVLLRVAKPQEVIIGLRRAGIFVRDRSSLPSLEQTIRVTMGYPAEMRRVLSAFAGIPAEYWRP